MTIVLQQVTEGQLIKKVQPRSSRLLLKLRAIKDYWGKDAGINWTKKDR
jgi:hypothetical protein